MAFFEYLKESLTSIRSVESITPKDLIDVMNDFKKYEQNLDTANREAFPLLHSEVPGKKFPKIDNIINEINKAQNLKGEELLIKFIEILKENGYFQDSWPFLRLVQKYGSQILDLYVTLNRDENVPFFLKKRS